MFWGFSLLESLFPILFFMAFGLVLGIFILSLVRGIRTYRKNNAAPVLTVQCRVVDKRMEVSHRMDGDALPHSFVRYYATFQVESGDRLEFAVEGQEYGQLAQGDCGRLTFQGTRYLGFRRSP